MKRSDLYQGRDPRELPAYTMADAARYLHVPAATLRSWFAGRTYPRRHGGVGAFEPLLTPADAQAIRLSFFNLVEAHVLRALRIEHDLAIRAIRPALDYAEQELGIQHVLLGDGLLTGAGELFLDHLGELVSLTRSGQLAMRRVLEAYLRRVDRDDRHIPIRLYPFLAGGDPAGTRTVVIDPRVSFGRPILAGSGVTTAILVQRIDAGETVKALADDYGVTSQAIEDAMVFERVRKAA